MFNIYMLSWDDVSGKKLLSVAKTQQHADDLVDEYSEMYPNAYVDYEESDWYNDPNCVMSRHHY